MDSHDFIQFPPDLSRLPSAAWFLLGRIQAKIQHLKDIPIPPDDALHDELHLVYLAKGVHATTAIEGNSFSEAEVQKIIQNDLKVPPSRAYQEQEIRNMLKAFNTLAEDERRGTRPDFSLPLLNRYHRLVLENAAQSDAVQIGALRTHFVTVGRYLAAPAQDCERLMAAYCGWLNEAPTAAAGDELAGQILKALSAHLYFAWIHPYSDGNGRMARLVEFAILLRAGVPDIAAHLLSNFYNKTRSRYYEQLQASHGEYQDGAYPPTADLTGFIAYALQGFHDELDEQMEWIYARQLQVIWHDFIHSSFPKNPNARQQRQKRLALDLTDRAFGKSLNISEIREITAAVAIAYNGRTKRTLRRDLKALVEMKLLAQDAEGYKPNTDILFRFFA